MHHTCTQCPESPEEGIKPPGTGVTDGFASTQFRQIIITVQTGNNSTGKTTWEKNLIGRSMTNSAREDA